MAKIHLQRLDLDRVMTNRKKYGAVSIQPLLVLQTWANTLKNKTELPQNWLIIGPRVLVGIEPNQPSATPPRRRGRNSFVQSAFPWETIAVLLIRASTREVRETARELNMMFFFRGVAINILDVDSSALGSDAANPNLFALRPPTISRWDPGHLRGLGPISILQRGLSQVIDRDPGHPRNPIFGGE
ncbi:hypothetical protein C8F04DRAFT_1176887 [Mycena alexandri]|uniref:Uncharacterized protein n=1 Tax=Mycena alexandri TaxID=1745969 RepID=A0AAD6TB68_9AGAR|nr:hypothetical protein C8F04DRAFT_1176887 [Mycena alexandri]